MLPFDDRKQRTLQKPCQTMGKGVVLIRLWFDDAGEKVNLEAYERDGICNQFVNGNELVSLMGSSDD